MITNLEVFTAGVTFPPIPILDQDVALDPIRIRNIDGLGPVKATINSTQYGSLDGESFDNSFTPKRNIVMTVGLHPDWANLTIEYLRQLLYAYFMPENTVRLRFSSTHMPVVEIMGIVESFEPNLFAKDPEYQISIICVQPYFVAIDQTVISGVTGAFGDTVGTDVGYQGNVDTGFVVDITMPESGSLPGGETSFDAGEIRLINQTPPTEALFVVPMTISTTTDFRVSTVDGDKYARTYPLPSGSPTNQLQYVSPGSTWLKLRKGLNSIQVLSDPVGLDWQLTYHARYGGL